jgi:hypothetical protein
MGTFLVKEEAFHCPKRRKRSSTGKRRDVPLPKNEKKEFSKFHSTNEPPRPKQK